MLVSCEAIEDAGSHLKIQEIQEIQVSQHQSSRTNPGGEVLHGYEKREVKFFLGGFLTSSISVGDGA